MNELRRIDESQAEDTEVIEAAPESGSRVIDLNSFQRRAEEGRQKAARLFAVHPANGQGTLKAHADPFERAIDVQDEVA